MISNPVEFYERSAGGFIIPNGSAEFPSEYVILALVESLVNNLKSCPVHAPKEFHPVVSAVLPFGYPKIEPTGPFKLREDAVPDVVKVITYTTPKTGMCLKYHFSFKTRST